MNVKININHDKDEDDYYDYVILQGGINDTAKGTWECIKCGTVNKSGTTHCDNCKAEYSSYINALAYRDSLTGIKNSTA